MKTLNLLLKRIWDICFSLLGLILSLPLWVIISLAIYVGSGRPIFYSDVRIGKDKRPYRHFKFRSMMKDAEIKTGPVWSKEMDMRITGIGRILRATAMDELPQLINILKGDMSFVGPRPERPFFVDKFIGEIPRYEERFRVSPGLTGIAQVYGKYNTSPKEKLKYDLEYIGKMNMFLDIKLMLLSFMITFHGGWAKFEK